MAAEKPYFKLHEKPEDTLRAWQRLLNHIIPRLNTDTAYIAVSTSTSATNATNVKDGVDSTYKSANLLKKHIVDVTATGGTSATNIGKVHVCNPTGNIDFTLPAGATGLWFKVINVSAHTVTMKCNGVETIDGSATQILLQYEAVEIVWSGTEWVATASHFLP
jgi:hypothetical protein